MDESATEGGSPQGWSISSGFDGCCPHMLALVTVSELDAPSTVVAERARFVGEPTNGEDAACPRSSPPMLMTLH